LLKRLKFTTNRPDLTEILTFPKPKIYFPGQGQLLTINIIGS